jgi:Lon protease-like protein
MELRLFPLHAVLFPGEPLQLQVFEPRYRQLVAECSEQREPFGVALIREGPEVGGAAVPFDLGTTAQILGVDPLVDGRLLVRALGAQRFRIVALHHDRPYVWADAEIVTDEGAAEAEVIARARRELAALQRLQATASGEYERDPKLPATAGALADRIAALAAPPPPEAQQLLETLEVGARLERALPLLRGVLERAHAEAAHAARARWAAPGMTN